MSKLLSIWLSLIIILQSFGLHFNDIAQIDEFIEHAQFHSEAYGDNVLVFISKHYGELKAAHEIEHQEEKKDHENLPFKHHCHLSTISAFTLNYIVLLTNTMNFTEIATANFHYQEPSSSFEIKGLLQPPRQS
ncbi:hypothetical protein GH721_00550 [Kriegella sp. EG-1]|nr:hypothetical protein [Flavobacteriaceae bacterium EG-1]